MPELLAIVLGAIVVNHFVLGRDTAAPDGARTGFAVAASVAAFSGAALLLAAAVTLPLSRVLQLSANAPYLQLPLLVGASVLATLMLALIARHKALTVAGAWRPLVMTNCTLLLLGLEAATRTETFWSSLLLGLGLAAGFGLSLLALTELFARIDQASVPRPFRGSPIVLIAAGLAALALLGLAGVLPD